MRNCSAVILTKNEQSQITQTIKNLGFAKEIIIIDDYSTDQTVKIAQRLGAKIYLNKLNENFAQQRNYALTKTKHDWVLFLDADERVSPALRKYILNLSPKASDSAYSFKRIDYFWHKKLHYGEVKNVYVPRLVNKNRGQFERAVHETWQATGKTIKSNLLLFHYPHPTLTEFIESINYYSTLNAQYFKSQGRKTSLFDIVFTPIFKFIYIYFIKLGFRDGVQGLVYSIMMSFHSFLSRTKLYLLLNND